MKKQKKIDQIPNSMSAMDWLKNVTFELFKTFFKKKENVKRTPNFAISK